MPDLTATRGSRLGLTSCDVSGRLGGEVYDTHHPTRGPRDSVRDQTLWEEPGGLSRPN